MPLKQKHRLSPKQLLSPLKYFQPKSSKTSVLGQKQPIKKVCFHQKAPLLPQNASHCYALLTTELRAFQGGPEHAPEE